VAILIQILPLGSLGAHTHLTILTTTHDGGLSWREMTHPLVGYFSRQDQIRPDDPEEDEDELDESTD